MSERAASELETLPEDEPSETVVEVLAAIADCEARFSARFYEIFFEERPDARPLFGAHPIAEQEEMTRETLRSLHAWSEGAPWLRDNLVALGRSHQEYGVTADMYDSFVTAMLACARDVLGAAFDDERGVALRAALGRIVQPMREAGDAAQAEAAARASTRVSATS